MLVMAGLRGRIIRHPAGFAEQRSEISRIPGRAGRFGRRSAIKPYLCWAAILESLAQSQCSVGTTMKRLVLASAIFLTFAPAVALAEGRGGDAALGALSGAVVFGPVGLVAGAVVGFTAGPSIAQSWRANRNHPRRVVRAKRQRVAAKPCAPAPVSAKPAAGSVTPAVNGFE